MDKRAKEESTKKQGEAQVEHSQTAPDEHMEAEGIIASNNPQSSAREAQKAQRGESNTVR